MSDVIDATSDEEPPSEDLSETDASWLPSDYYDSYGDPDLMEDPEEAQMYVEMYEIDWPPARNERSDALARLLTFIQGKGR